MSDRCVLSGSYQPVLDTRRVEHAIKEVKDFFEAKLAKALNLTRVSAPLFVRRGSGINDDLNGVERPVSFLVRDAAIEAEIVQSLAKWKRLALARYGFAVGEGLYTDMNAIRPDETLDHLHSIYVDQWDWEKVIDPTERTRATLEEAVRSIYEVICRTEFYIAAHYPAIRPLLPSEIHIVTSEELQRRFPELSPREREDRICAEYGAVFVLGIGAELADGHAHDGRAPDYDDWSTSRPDGGCGLNGDILLHNPVLGRAFEISSMGVRVDPAALMRQLELRGMEARAELEFHRRLLGGSLPQTMGGGIGQSRLCMFFLRTAHIGEVAVGIWPPEMEERCAEANVFLL
jgi:aspartate--ammonia ligase